MSSAKAKALELKEREKELRELLEETGEQIDFLMNKTTSIKKELYHDLYGDLPTFNQIAIGERFWAVGISTIGIGEEFQKINGRHACCCSGEFEGAVATFHPDQTVVTSDT